MGGSLLFFRDFVPDLFNNRFAIGYIPVRQVRGCGSIQYRAARLWLCLRYGLFDLQSADFFRFFIRNQRLAWIAFFAFFHEEYLIAPVDFIVALRRTKGRGRRTLRSPPSPSSGLHLIHPGCPLRRGMTAAAVDRDIGRLYPVLSIIPSSEFCFVICVRLCIARVSVDFAGLVSFVFHWWWDGLFIPAATWCFAMVYRWNYR